MNVKASESQILRDLGHDKDLGFYSIGDWKDWTISEVMTGFYYILKGQFRPRRISCQEKDGQVRCYRCSSGERWWWFGSPNWLLLHFSCFLISCLFTVSRMLGHLFSWLPSCPCLSFGSSQSWSSAKNYCVAFLEVIPGGRSEASTRGVWTR